MYSIEKTKIAAAGIFDMIAATDRAAQDGIGVDDIPILLGPLSEMPAALVALKDVPNELKDLDNNERQELSHFLQREFDIADDKLELALEEVFKAMVQLKKAYDAVKTAMA